ncbi:MAG: hypothetical protein OHK0015_53530 [Chloroflexi bacterium OHK40]
MLKLAEDVGAAGREQLKGQQLLALPRAEHKLDGGQAGEFGKERGPALGRAEELDAHPTNVAQAYLTPLEPGANLAKAVMDLPGREVELLTESRRGRRALREE